MNITNILRKLTETAGPSGMEQEIAATITDLWRPYVDSVTTDRIGNLIAVKNGSGQAEARRLLVAAHMDEIALMVKEIVRYPEHGAGEDEAYGFLRVTGVGGVDVRHLYGQQVVVHGRRDLRGLVGALPVQMLPKERHNKPYNYDELLVDVGLPLARVKEVVAVGDFVSFRQPLRKLLNRRLAGKAMDNRASVAAVAVSLEYLQGRHHDWDVVAVATAQEETRLLGAFTSAYAHFPDAAIALDVTFGKGPGAKDEGKVYELGEGPTIDFGPNVHPGLYKKLQEAAKALEMDVHPSPHTRGSGTDAFGLQIARSGIPTGLIGIPLRYMHTMVETVDAADVERAGRLLGEFIARLDASFLKDIAKEMMSES